MGWEKDVQKCKSVAEESSALVTSKCNKKNLCKHFGTRILGGVYEIEIRCVMECFLIQTFTLVTSVMCMLCKLSIMTCYCNKKA